MQRIDITDIGPARRMCAARDTVVKLIGRDNFLAYVNELRPTLEDICAIYEVSQAQAAADIVEQLRGRGLEMVIAFAACAEIVDPIYGNGEIE